MKNKAFCGALLVSFFASSNSLSAEKLVGCSVDCDGDSYLRWAASGTLDGDILSVIDSRFWRAKSYRVDYRTMYIDGEWFDLYKLDQIATTSRAMDALPIVKEATVALEKPIDIPSDLPNTSIDDEILNGYDLAIRPQLLGHVETYVNNNIESSQLWQNFLVALANALSVTNGIRPEVTIRLVDGSSARLVLTAFADDKPVYKFIEGTIEDREGGIIPTNGNLLLGEYRFGIKEYGESFLKLIKLWKITSTVSPECKSNFTVVCSDEGEEIICESHREC